MTIRLLSIVLLITSFLFPAVAQASDVPLLEATFEQNDLGPLGTGGASAGEATSIAASLDAEVVAAGVFPSKSVKITDQADFGSTSASFEFLGAESVDRGIVTVSVDVLIPASTAPGQAQIYVRERQTASRSYASLVFYPTRIEFGTAGQVRTRIADGVLDTVVQVLLVFDLEKQTVSLTIDGEELVAGLYCNVADLGIGQVIVGVSSGETGDLFYIDNLQVSKRLPPVGTELLSADFEDKTSDISVGMGGAALGEPSFIDGALGAVVRSELGTKLLEVIDESTNAAQQLEFTLLDSVAVDQGEVLVRLGLHMEDVGTYRILFTDFSTERGSDQELFEIAFVDSGGSAREFGIYDQSPVDSGVAFHDPSGEEYVIDRGRVIRLEALINLSGDSYSLRWDGEELVSDRHFGVAGAGFGRIVLRIDETAELGNSFLVDGILVEDPTLFVDGFESGSVSSWQ